MASQQQEEDFPVVCETCLGPNPFIRMMKDTVGRKCKVCERPFVVYRWKPGGDDQARYKKTEICSTCAKVKNVCQTCILDLKFGLPVAVRDESLKRGLLTANASTKSSGASEPKPSQALMAAHASTALAIVQSAPTSSVPGASASASVALSMVVPKSEKMREYISDQNDRLLASNPDALDGWYNSTAAQQSSLASRVARAKPRYDRNRAHVCEFFLKGECTRGVYCPYRHEKPSENEAMKDQKLKNRYYGVSDPVANKILRGASDKTGKDGRPNPQAVPEPPSDVSVKSLFVNLTDNRSLSAPAVSEQALQKAVLEAAFASTTRDNIIEKIRVIPNKNIAFIDFNQRSDAEHAIDALYRNLEVDGRRLNINWARPRTAGDSVSAAGGENGNNSHGFGSVYKKQKRSENNVYRSQDPLLLGSAPNGKGLGNQ